MSITRQWTQEVVGKDAREALKRGVDAVHGPVHRTMGAKGRNAAYAEYGSAKATNDGISVARRIWPKDPGERLGADFVKEAAEATLKEAGDGTSGTIDISHALAELGEKAIQGGKDPMELKRELEEAAAAVTKVLHEKMSTPVNSREDILNVARISVEDEEMAVIVADSVEAAGKYGVVIVEEGSGYKIEKSESRGYFWERGFVSPYMVTNIENGIPKAILEDCPIIVTNYYMNLNRDLMQTLNTLNEQGINKCLIVVDRCEGELLVTLNLNKQKQIFTAIVVQCPGSLAELEDIAAVTGATAITKDKGIKQITSMHMGRVKRVVAEEGKTTIIADERAEVQTRIEEIEGQLAQIKKDKGEPDETLIIRKAKLGGGVVVIRVGAKTEAERKYKKDKMDDAVAAGKAATEEGIVPGGGTTLHTIAQEGFGLDTIGAQVLRAAMRSPYQRILNNAGILPDGKNYNVRTGKVVKDMIKEGIIDPTKVARCQVENAVTFAGLYLTIETLIIDCAEETTG